MHFFVDGDVNVMHCLPITNGDTPMSNAIKYEVEWTPWVEVVAAATKAGWAPTDGTGDADVIDFVSIDDFERREVFDKFSQARKRAWSLVDADTWKCPRIRRFVRDLSDPTPDGWENDATWEIFDSTTPVFEAMPDWMVLAA